MDSAVGSTGTGPAASHTGEAIFGVGLRTQENLLLEGRVTEPSGEPVSGAYVRVEVLSSSAPPLFTQTDLKGQYSTELSLDIGFHEPPKISLVATKPGYLRGWESADFQNPSEIGPINIVLPADHPDPDLLASTDLMRVLVPRLRPRIPEQQGVKKLARFLDHATDDLLVNGRSFQAAGHFEKLVAVEPACVECHLLWGLALLNSGNWGGAYRQFSHAAQLDEQVSPANRNAEPLLLLGVMESWRREDRKALDFLLRAAEIAPRDPLVLQELGRSLVFLRNWEAADDYLARAIAAGSSDGARLLRVEALLKLDDLGEAARDLQVYMTSRRSEQIPRTAQLLNAELAERLKLSAYGKPASLVETPIEELLKQTPELKGLAVVQSQEGLPAILSETGEGVEAYFRNLPNTAAVEEIRSEKFDREGKPHTAEVGKYWYLFLTGPDRQGMNLREYRRRDMAADLDHPASEGYALKTMGFVSSPLVFHPHYQAGSAFRLLGKQTLNGRPAWVLAFAQRPEKGVVLERFRRENISVPVMTQGIAWIDVADYRILRMLTDLLKSPPGSRLIKRRTSIQFAEVRFNDAPQREWYPREVTVTVQWKGKTFRNTHWYSDFRLFDVEAKENERRFGLVSTKLR